MRKLLSKSSGGAKGFGMVIYRLVCGYLLLALGLSSASFAQERKLEKLRTGGGSASATQMSLWLAKEGNYYEKNGLNVEVISIPGSSLALQAMLSGELPIIRRAARVPFKPLYPAQIPSSSLLLQRNLTGGFSASRASIAWRI
jgi:hypothetical protein